MGAPAISIKRIGSLKNRSSDHASQELHRLAELGRVSASLLHEIGNPLTSALLHIEKYADKNSPSLQEVRRSIKRIYTYVEAARQQARSESRQASFGICAQVAQVKRLVQPLARKAGVKLIINDLPGCRLYGDRVKFQQILANLIINAIEAYERDEACSIEKIVKVEITAGQKLTIKVHDHGSGIAVSDIKRIFEPFFTTKSLSGHGLGIGLELVKQYVDHDFKGSLYVHSSRRRGTQFIINLPLK